MGQKIKPTSLRMGYNRNWTSLWFANHDYAAQIKEDNAIRSFLMDKLGKQANVARIVIERPNRKCRVFIHTSRPGVIIGKKGADIETLRKQLQEKSKSEVVLNIVEIRKPDADAQLIADNIASQLEKRIAYRRASKRALQNAMQNGAKGIKVRVSGRLNGAEIARTEWAVEGSVPLHTLRADVDFGFAEAHTTYGKIGVQVWVHHGEKYAIDYTSQAQ